MSYNVGDVVWLKETTPPEEPNPRQLAVVLIVQENQMYAVEVDAHPADEGDDGLRELHEEQIEGLATREESQPWLNQHHRTPAAQVYLDRAGPYIGYQP